MDDKDHTFWIFRKKGTYGQPNTVHVIPLLLYNQIESSNLEDQNIENMMMICKNDGSTVIKCYYDSMVTSGPDKVYECKFGVEGITGDLDGK